MKRLKIAAPLAVLLLAGCAGFSRDGGMDDVSALTSARIGQPVQRQPSAQESDALRAQLAPLLGKPLTAESAVHIALLNNRSLQVALADVGVAEADLVQAGRLRNPGFSFDRLRGGGNVEIDRGVVFDVAGLLTMPLRREVEQRRFAQSRLQAAAAALRLAAATRAAYFNAVAAQQSAQYSERISAAAQAGAQLAAEMAKTGNWSRAQHARERLFYAEAVADVARARQRAVAAREKLTRLLGLWGADTAFTLSARLPKLPASIDASDDIEAQAIANRIDVQIARRNAEASAAALGLSKASSWINVLDVGYANKSTSGAPRENGYSIALELPLFDWGDARNAKGEALYLQAVQRTADTAVRARSQARENYLAYRTSYDLARHYRDEVVPLRKRVSDDVLLRYNGMLASVFDLLADARAQIAGVSESIAAQRDFWLAQSRLQNAIYGSGGSAAESEFDQGEAP